MASLSPNDPSSFSRPEIAVIRHVSLVLNVNFEEKTLEGTATYDIDVLQNKGKVVFDVTDQTIESVQLDDDVGTHLHYVVDREVINFGKKLSIFIPPLKDDQSERVRIKIQYQTSPSASALQWLEPNQTRGKKYQYLFSQCQPIHARSILPCQDTPAVKFTYDAEVTAPPNFTVLMSALREPSSNNTFKFRQPVPIPSYLLAIAVGVLESKSLGPRSTVWAEPEDLERSAYEFEDTEKYLQAAERLCGPYVWGQYDLLVLPPSFPYGGMENPCLTFVTPTLLAGDKSQADVIVHEIMHSWTGNLVTNKNFEHFWLNEGWTVFLERKVGPSLVKDPVEAKKIRDFQSILGLQELNETIIHTLGETNALTCLVPNLKEGVHPDDAFSTVPYEKGSLFLRYLEDKIGGPEKFDDFIRAYLQKYKMKSLDTDEFREFFSSYFANEEAVEDIDWGVWLYGPGMPPIIPQYDTSMTKEVKELLDRFYTPDFVPAAADVQNFSVHQKIHLLQNLIDGAALPIDKLRKIGDEYNLKSSGNTELQFRFIRLTVKSKDMDSLKDTFEFLNGQGRMKYVRPIYRDLYAWEEVRKQTIQNFLDNEKYMMYVSAYTIRKDLQLTFY